MCANKCERRFMDVYVNVNEAVCVCVCGGGIEMGTTSAQNTQTEAVTQHFHWHGRTLTSARHKSTILTICHSEWKSEHHDRKVTQRMRQCHEISFHISWTVTMRHKREQPQEQEPPLSEEKRGTLLPGDPKVIMAVRLTLRSGLLLTHCGFSHGLTCACLGPPLVKH